MENRSFTFIFFKIMNNKVQNYESNMQTKTGGHKDQEFKQEELEKLENVLEYVQQRRQA